MVYANDEQLWKASFVESELSDTLKVATRGFVDYCQYCAEGAEEAVIVRLVCGNGDYDTMRVCVTADSCWAILKDVLRAVADRFE